MQLEALRSGGKRAVARALSRLDRDQLSQDNAALLDAAFNAPQGLVLGLTGPPGVGKSTLTQALIEAVRTLGQSVAVVAVDPSSQKTGGALLGDRTRLHLDPDDRDVFVRSLAARDRLGGLSTHAIAATILLRALYDVVLVETVGIGQSDADVTLIADRTLLCIQPGSGDALQFMKAGIMEWPDVICVTKADIGAPARRACADVEGALGLATHDHAPAPVHLVSARTGDGIEGLVASLLLACTGDTDQQSARLLIDATRQRFGSHGVEKLDVAERLKKADGPFGAILATQLAFYGHS